MPLDPQAAAWLEANRELGIRPYEELPVAEGRRLTDERAPAVFGEPDTVEDTADMDAGGVPVRIYRPVGGAEGALVYLHGGGWVLGSLESHGRLCQTLAARAGITVLALDYRLAPEHPYPAAVDDAWTATRWAAERYRPLAIAGDSAGGHLAAVTALRARDHGLPLALQVLVYPVTDHAFDTPSYREYGTGTSLTERTMRWYWDQFVPETGRRGEPMASPLRAPDLSGVAPALVLTAECDPLCSEGDAYADRLSAAGVATKLTRYPGQIHGFFRMPAVIDEAKRAIDEVAAAVRSTLTDPVGAR